MSQKIPSEILVGRRGEESSVIFNRRVEVFLEKVPDGSGKITARFCEAEDMNELY